MAYIITVSAPTYANAHNDIIFSVYDNVRSNNQTLYPDFTYICDVYANGVFVGRLRAVPDPTYFAGVFNIKRVLQDYMATVIIPSPTEEETRLDFNAVRLAYQLKFGSEYGSTLTTNEMVDSSRFVYNSYDKINLSNGGAFLYSSETISMFRTDRPGSVNVEDTGGAAFIPFYNPSTGSVNVVCKSYGATGTLLDTQNLAIPASGLCTLNGSRNGIKGLLTVEDEGSCSFTYGGATYGFNWVCNPKFTNYTVGFLNRYGGFESFDFYKASATPIQIERKSIETLPYSTGASGSILYGGAGRNYGSVNNYSNGIGRKVKIKSDWIDDATYIWLEQLVVSPQVYLFGGGFSNWTRVILTNTDYEPKQFVKDGLTILELEFDFAGYSPQRL